MSGQIFINYRREDGRWSARSLYDRLVARFGRKQIFMDVDSLKPGVDFFEAIEKSVGSCDVLIAIIGTHWLSCSDEEGQRRLDDPKDFVRVEIAAALRREIRVIPVLLDGAAMPRESDLPDDLQLLVRRNALPVSDTGFDDDCKRLVATIEQVFKDVETERREREGKVRLEAKRQAAAAKQRAEEERRQQKDPQRLEQPSPSPPMAPVRRRVRTGNERWWRIAGIILLVGVVAGLAEVVAIYLMVKRQAVSMAAETPLPSVGPSPAPVVTTSSPPQQAQNREPSPAPKLPVATTPVPAESPAAPAQFADQKFAYALTTTTDPAQPGKVAQFTVTATNLTSAREYLRLNFQVPKFTRYRGSAEGVAVDLAPGWVGPGASVSTYIDLTVIGGNQSPPDGSVIALALVDPERGASFSRSVTVKAGPIVSLHLSTGQGTVAPGEAFGYILTYHNAGADTLNPAQLNMQLPAGSSFLSADKGGVPGPDGVVRWPMGKLTGGTGQQVHLSLKAPTNSGAQPSLVAQAALGDSVNSPLAQASDAKAIYATPTFSYALSTRTGPAPPGKIAQFTVTSTNLSDAREYLQFAFHVPRFTTFRNYPEGTACDLVPGWVNPGASVSTNIDLTVTGGNQSPPDGSIIALGLADLTRGASVSRSVRVRAASTTVLNLSTGQGTVAPGEVFGYTMTYNNVSDTLKSVQLKVQLAKGVSVVSADQGAMLGSDGVVQWPAGPMAGGTAQHVHLNLKAPTAMAGGPSLLVQATLENGNGNLLTQASDAKAIYATPTFSYALTTTSDPAQAGKVAQFTVTVNNLSDARAYLTFVFRVPRFTTYHSYTEGMTCDVAPGWVNAGASVSTNIDLNVVGGYQSPPEGSIITLELRDQERGAAVSRTIGVNGG